MVAVARSLVCGQLLGHDTGVFLAGFVEADHWGERMLVKNMWTISFGASNKNMNSPKIGRATCTVASSWIGITMPAPLTFPCRSSSKSFSSSTSTRCCQNINTAHTLLPLNNMAPKLKLSSHQHLPKLVPWGNQGDATCHWQHIILFPGCQHHCTYGIEFHCNWAIKWKHKHDGKNKAIVRLLGNISISGRPTWFSMSIRTHCISQSPMRAAKLVAISLWVGPPKMATQSASMVPFSHYVLS